eukprot:256298_1
MSSSWTLQSLLLTLALAQSQTLISPTSTGRFDDGILFEKYEGNQESQSINGYIICNTSTCIITCDQELGCRGLTIDASNSNTLTLTCNDDYSCLDTIITSGAQTSTQIDCRWESSCKGAEFQVSNSQTVNMHCSYQLNIKAHETCQDVMLNTSLSSNVNLECKNHYTCTDMDIICPYDNECNIRCGAFSGAEDHSCNRLNVFVQNKDLLNLNCLISPTSCYRVSIFCGVSTSAPQSMLSYIDDEGWYCSSQDCCPWYTSTTTTTNALTSDTTIATNAVTRDATSTTNAVTSGTTIATNALTSDTTITTNAVTNGMSNNDMSTASGSTVAAIVGAIFAALCGCCIIYGLIWFVHRKSGIQPPVHPLQQQQQKNVTNPSAPELDVLEQEAVPNPSAPMEAVEVEMNEAFHRDNIEGENQKYAVGENECLAIRQWFDDDVDLDEYNEVYFKTFIENGFDKFRLIEKITKNDLIEIGINKLGHQKEILSAADNLNVSKIFVSKITNC